MCTKRRKFSNECKQQICDQAISTESIKELACTHNLQTSQIYIWLKEYGNSAPAKKKAASTNVIPFKSKDKQTVKELKSLINDLVEEREKYLKIIQSIIIDEANELNKRIRAI